MTKQEKIQWCLDQHTNTNHYYDNYIPYEFHLRMVVQVFKDFKHLIKKLNLIDGTNQDDVFELACFGHDLIEDTRTSYNDVKKVLGEMAANIIYAVSNEKGKTRSERANDKYYEGIRNTLGAVFVKLCDRIANIQYSKLTKSRMFEMYKKENDHFMEQLGYSIKEDHELDEMFEYLQRLFED